MLVSVILVNYNGAQLLERSLSALARQTCAPHQVILVDNASTDDSCALVTRRFPDIHLIRNKTNVGFAQGNNLGIAAATGEAIVTLNTDTEAAPDFLEKLVMPLADAQVGACAPLMLELEHPGIVDAAGIRVDSFGFAWNIGAGQPAAAFQTPGEVYGACAGAALYRRAMLDEIGAFDESYFGFYEDADLAWRAHRAGWKTMFVPSARVLHVHGASFGKISPRKTYLLARNRWWTLMKNEPRARLYLKSPAVLALDWLSLARTALSSDYAAAWQGRMDAWREPRAFQPVSHLLR